MGDAVRRLDEARSSLQAEALRLLVIAQARHGVGIPPANFPLTGLVRRRPDLPPIGLLSYAVETDGMAREVGRFIGWERMEAGGASPVRDIVWEQLRWLGVVSPRARRSDPFVEATFAYVAGYRVRDTRVAPREVTRVHYSPRTSD